MEIHEFSATQILREINFGKPYEIVKMAIFEILDLTELISRNFLVLEKFLNFHTDKSTDLGRLIYNFNLQSN